MAEQFLVEFRRHAYVLALPTLVLGVCSGLGAFLVATVPESGARDALRAIISVGIVLLVLRWAVWPFAGWYGNTHVVTTERVFRRQGVFAKHGTELALNRVVGIALTRSMLQRMLGAGRLTVEYHEVTAPGGRATWVLDDVPLVADVQQLLLALTAAGGRPPPDPPRWPVDPALPDFC